MKIKSVEIKQSQTGKTYKSVKFEGKFQDKDMTNVFPNHPLYESLTPGGEVSDSTLYINPKGYLSISDRMKEPEIKPADVKIGFIEHRLKEMDEKITRILIHVGAATPQEIAYATPVKPITFDPKDGEITDADVPF